MKKFLITCLFPLSLLSAPAKNPAEPNLLNKGFFIPQISPVFIRVSYEGNYTSNARLKQTQEGSGRVDNFELFSNLGLFVFNIDDHFDLYGGFGATTIDSNWRFNNTVGGISRVSLESNNRYSWTMGANATIFKWGDAYLGGGMRYSGVNTNLAWITVDGVNTATNNAKLRWLQWQVEAAIGCRIGFFTPYLGGKYSNVRVSLQSFNVAIAQNDNHDIHMENRNHVGAYLGVTLTNGDFFMLTLEGRIIDEEAVSVSGDVRF